MVFFNSFGQEVADFFMFAKKPRGLSFCGTRQNVQFVKHVFSSIKSTLVKTSIFLKGRQQKYHFHSLILCLCSGFAEATSAPTIKLDGKGDQEKYNISQLPDFLFLSCPRPLGRCDKMPCLLFNLLFKRWLCFGEMQRSCFFNNDAKEQWLRASFWIHGVKIVWVELFPAELCNDENCSRSSTHSRIYRWSFFKATDSDKRR